MTDSVSTYWEPVLASSARLAPPAEAVTVMSSITGLDTLVKRIPLLKSAPTADTVEPDIRASELDPNAMPFAVVPPVAIATMLSRRGAEK